MTERLSPRGRGRKASKEAIRGRGFSLRGRIFLHPTSTASADRYPSSGANFVRATFSHKGRREGYDQSVQTDNALAPAVLRCVAEHAARLLDREQGLELTEPGINRYAGKMRGH